MTTDSGRPLPFAAALDGSEAVIGRDPSCELVLTGVGVSRRHAVLILDPDTIRIRDCGSSFGLRVDGEQVSEAVLHEGSTVGIGVVHLRVGIVDSSLVLSPDRSAPSDMPAEAVETGGVVTIGRDATSDIQCPHPLVSRLHARLEASPDGAHTLVDQQSTNGTYVNGERVRKAPVHDGDIVQVGPYRLFMEEGRLIKADDFNRVRLEAVGLRLRRGRKQVLDNMSLTVDPGQFVAILGPSGAGKSTLAYVLTGQVAPDQGDVFLNAMPLKQFSQAFSSSIGYVSQHNLLPQELTVLEIFREQAVLRLPADSSRIERRRRIEEVVELLELGGVLGKQVRLLSGGEAKRVHLGIELLASPALIVLDEPLAGLDFGLIRSFMVLFRKISDRGHTVLLTTHTLEQIDLCDRVLFVNNGCLVYQGSPGDMGSAFGVESIAEVYGKVKRENITRLGGAPSPAATGRIRRSSGTMPLVRHHRRASAPLWRQFALLVMRYLRTTSRDVKNLVLVVAQVPLIVLLLAFVFKPGSTFFPISFYFAVTVSVIWIGGVNTVREIAREWPIVFREYRAGLSVTAFVAAKTAVFTVLAAAQGLLFGGFLTLFFAHLSVDWQLLLVLVCASVGGAVLGLSVSAMSAKVNRAISLLPIMFIPQIFLAGALMPFDKMARLGRWLSHATLSRPVFTLLKRNRVLEQSLWLKEEWYWYIAVVAGLSILMWVSVGWRARRGGGSR